jgi:hypothetical protein
MDEEDLVFPSTGDESVEIRAGPAYNVDAWRTENSRGPQCSQTGEFCYLCSFRSDALPDEDVDVCDDEPDENKDWVTRVKSAITTLVAEGRDRPSVVISVYNMYNTNIRPYISYTHAFTGQSITRPTWTRGMIDRHITYSSEWPELFETTVDQTLHAIMDSQNSLMRDMDSNEIIEDRRKAWMDSLNHLIKWKTFRKSQKSISGACKSRKKT